MFHVSICVFHRGPAGREVELFVKALSYRGPPLVGDVLHTHGRKTAPLTPRRILAERLQILEGCCSVNLKFLDAYSVPIPL